MIVANNLLTQTMVLAMISLTFPLQIILQYIFAKLTNRVFFIRMQNVADILIACCVIVWFYVYDHFYDCHNDGYNLTGTSPHKAVVFSKATMTAASEG